MEASMLNRARIVGWGGALVATLLAGSAAAVEPAEKCQAAKLKETGKYGLCRLKAEAKAVKRGSAGGLPAALAKCDAKLQTKWSALEAKAGTACPTNGDAGRLGRLAIDFSGVATLQLAGERFVDHGDGTITDTQTRLTWEKKNAADDVADFANPHDVDNLYTWSVSGSARDGTAFTEFLGALNNCFSPLGNDGFAGHCDWRLPTYAELQSIFDRDQGLCETEEDPFDTDPCVDPIFIPTLISGGRGFLFYWSSISVTALQANAWGFDFTSCVCPKTGAQAVRAVRDDLPPLVSP
jgi:hypothetical protein